MVCFNAFIYRHFYLGDKPNTNWIPEPCLWGTKFDDMDITSISLYLPNPTCGCCLSFSNKKSYDKSSQWFKATNYHNLFVDHHYYCNDNLRIGSRSILKYRCCHIWRINNVFTTVVLGLMFVPKVSHCCKSVLNISWIVGWVITMSHKTHNQ